MKKKALFFDRDGTLIRSKLSKDKRPVAIKEFSELKIYPSVKKILEKLNNDYLIFVYTNQPDVGRKINTVSNVKKINNYLVKNLPIKKFILVIVTQKNVNLENLILVHLCMQKKNLMLI